MTDLEQSEALVIRRAEATDIPAVAAIFAHYVTDTLITFELHPPCAEDWRAKQHDLEILGWPFLVAVLDKELIGCAYVMPWRSQAGLPAHRREHHLPRPRAHRQGLRTPFARGTACQDESNRRQSGHRGNRGHR
jgi:L-amino acid N-acyltransferase YncA